ncbi:MAG: hypothetical protein LUC87_07150 [Clostridiales bacterium]|nr:hypothetical protein [Clostridiales bacterium]
MNLSSFQAGAGIATVLLPDNCLPIGGFSGIHDDLHVRVLLMESNLRFALISIEITSITDESLTRFRTLASNTLEIELENIWITLTHSFAGPHIWPAAKVEPRRSGRHDFSEKKQRSPEELHRCALLEDAYCDALETAAKQALTSLAEATIGWGEGLSAVNISRNLPTNKGWWIGANPEAPCDHSVRVLRIDHRDGSPVALLYNFGIRPCVVSGLQDKQGNNLISADISGVTSNYLEQEFGNCFVAIFLCGAAGDQEPILKAKTETLNHCGIFSASSLGAEGYVLLDALSTQLRADVIRIWRRIDFHFTPQLRLGQRSYTVQTKQMNRDLSSLQPVESIEFTASGQKTLEVYALNLGGFNLVGVQPELNGKTTTQISEAFPGDITATAIMVNGCDKCMPEEAAYQNVQYQCLNSPFMPGAAEIMLHCAIELLQSLKGIHDE